MKKFITIVLFALSVQSTYAQKNSDDIISAITNFNPNENLNSFNNDNEKKWWQTLLNVCTVVVADCGGAYAGVQGTIGLAGAVGLATGGTGVAVVAGVAGVIGAAGASNGAYQGLNRISVSEPSFGGLSIVLPEKYKFYQNIGIDHNNVIHNVFFSSQPTQSYYNTLLDEEQKKLIESKDVITNLDFCNSIGTFYVENGQNISTLTNLFVKKGIMSEFNKKIFEVFFEKYNQCSSPKDMENLINLAVEQINISNLDEKDKLAFIAAFMVASESPFYMNPKK